MKDKEKTDKVPVDMFMMLAENAKAVNVYAGLEFAGQQLLLESFAKAGSKKEKQKLIEDLTK